MAAVPEIDMQPWIDVDWTAFDPWRIQTVRHRLQDHPLLRWRDAFRERAHVFDLEPWQGAYMPSTSPHMVENGDGPSVTVSFTYYTDSTRAKACRHARHGALRKLGLQPSSNGQPGWRTSLGAALLTLRGEYRTKVARACDEYAEDFA